MRPNRSITVSLPEDMIELVEKKVASGEFANESEVVAEGLRQLAEDDVDQWIRDAVVPALDEHDADPSAARTAEETRQELHEHIRALDQRGRSW